MLCEPLQSGFPEKQTDAPFVNAAVANALTHSAVTVSCEVPDPLLDVVANVELIQKSAL